MSVAAFQIVPCRYYENGGYSGSQIQHSTALMMSIQQASENLDFPHDDDTPAVELESPLQTANSTCNLYCTAGAILDTDEC